VASGTVESQSANQNQNPEDKNRGLTSRSRLVQRLVAAPPNLPAFMTDLITAQAITVGGTEAAGFVIEPDGRGSCRLARVAHVRHDDSPEDVRQAALQAFAEIVRPCIQQGRDGAIEVGGASPENPEPQFCLVTLLRAEGQLQGASAVITRCRDLERAQQRLDSMRLVAGFFDLYGLRRTNEQQKVIAQSHQDVLQFAAAVATADGFQQGAANLCNELASKSGAARVSVGWVHGEKVKLKALSHTEQFDKKQELSVQVIKVMEECLDQEEVVQYDPAGEASTQNVTREAAALSRMEGGSRVVSLPLRRKNGEICGILTLEFPSTKKPSAQETTSLAVAADLLAPQLYDRYHNDRWLITKAGISARETTKLAIGPKHMLAKLITAAVIGLLVFISVYSPMFTVKAPFSFVAQDRRIVSSPLEQGIISKVHVRPDQEVKAGDVLLEFQTNEIDTRLLQARYRKNAALKEADRYLNDPAGDKMAEYRVAVEQANEAQADIDYFELQKEKATVRAPIDGVILQGDLEDRRGSTVKLGDVLFEIAPRGAMRVDLFVNERDIQRVEVGDVGELATRALPQERHRFTVTRIIPVAEARENASVFRVQAEVDQVDPSWRPGMAGEARVDIEPRPLIWIWTHRLVEFLRMYLWW
jgi:multidrug resistance efflux pump